MVPLFRYQSSELAECKRETENEYGRMLSNICTHSAHIYTGLGNMAKVEKKRKEKQRLTVFIPSKAITWFSNTVPNRDSTFHRKPGDY